MTHGNPGLRAGTVAAVLVVTLLLPGCSASSASTQAPDFRLTNQHGEEVSLSGLRGGAVVLTFLYTHCPDTCPLYLFQIKLAVEGLEPSDDISVVVVTVDPERDTVQHLEGFAGSWPPNWYFLTGNPVQVARVWGDYGVYVEKEEAGLHSERGGYGVIHTAKVVVVDRGGNTAAELKGDWTPKELQQNLAAVLTGKQLKVSRVSFGPILGLLQRCGEFASSHPWTFMGLVLLIMIPGLVLPIYLLRTFLHVKGQQG